MSITDPSETQEHIRAMHEKIIALGAVPVTNDLLGEDSENRLWRQLLSLLGAGGGSSVMYVGHIQYGPGPQQQVSSPPFILSPFSTVLPGTNWQLNPQTALIEQLGTGSAYLMGPAPDAGDVINVPAGFSNMIWAPVGVVPNAYQIQLDFDGTVGGAPTCYTFSWKGIPGVVFVSFPVN